MRKKEDLDLYVESCVMNRVNYKRKINPKTNEEYYEGTYQLSFFDKDNLTEEEIEYVFNQLNDKQILVVGTSPALYGDFENYRYIKRTKRSDNQEVYDEEKLKKIMYHFKTMKTETEEEQKEKKLIRKKIISMNTRLVDFVVSRFNTNNVFNSDELASYAYEGLILAVDNYDIGKGSFSAFALKYIEGYLIRGMQSLRGFSSVNFYYRYKKAKTSLEEALGSVIENDLEYLDEIANRIFDTYNRHLDTVEEIKTRISLMNTLPLDEIDNHVYDDNTIYNEVIESINKEFLKGEIDKILSELTSREKEIMIEKYGLKGGRTKTCREVANNIGCHYQSVNKLEKRALKRLRNNCVNSQLEEYYANLGEYDYSPTGIELPKVKQKSK